MYNTIIEYKRARYLWLTLALVVVCSVLYLSQGEMTPPNGGTWQGYVLGTLGALLIVWLALLGIVVAGEHKDARPRLRADHVIHDATELAELVDVEMSRELVDVAVELFA